MLFRYARCGMSPATHTQFPDPAPRRLSGTSAMLIGTAASAVSVYVYQVVAGRSLGAEAFAPISILWTVTFLVFAILNLPVEQYLTRHLALTRGMSAGGAATLFRVGIALVAGVVLGTGFVVLTLDRFFGGMAVYAVLMATNLTARAMLAVARGFLAGRRRFHAYGVVVALDWLSIAALAVIVAAVAPSTVAFAWIIAIGPLTALLVRPFRRVPNLKGTSAAVHQGSGFLWGLIVATAASQSILAAGPIVLGVIGGTASSVSMLFITFTLFRGPVTSSYDLTARVLPYFTALASSGQQHRLSVWAGRIGAIGLAVVAVFGLAGRFLGPTVVTVLYGEEFAPSPTLSMLAAAAVGAALVALILNQIYVARGDTTRLAVIWLAAAALAVLVLLLWQGESVTRIGLAFLAGEFVAMALLTTFGAFVLADESTQPS